MVSIFCSSFSVQFYSHIYRIEIFASFYTGLKTDGGDGQDYEFLYFWLYIAQFI